MKGAIKDITECLNSNIYTYLIKDITDPQEHTTNDTRRVKSELINKRDETDNVQYYNKHQESIILNIVTENNVYNKYSYTSYVN